MSRRQWFVLGGIGIVALIVCIVWARRRRAETLPVRVDQPPEDVCSPLDCGETWVVRRLYPGHLSEIEGSIVRLAAGLDADILGISGTAGVAGEVTR